jgi:hypothetical protein
MGRWQLRTWTKGTGAAVEPAGATDHAPAPARPGRPRALPPRADWTAGADTRPAAAGSHRTALAARRRHAGRYASDEAIERLERLEADLLGRRTG